MFDRYHKEVNIVEGVMGLYDGYDRWKGSSAELAAILDLPVLLIVNARSMAYSAAAIIHGFTSLPCNDLPRLRFAGIIFNQVGSERHASFLKKLARTRTRPVSAVFLAFRIWRYQAAIWDFRLRTAPLSSRLSAGQLMP